MFSSARSWRRRLAPVSAALSAAMVGALLVVAAPAAPAGADTAPLDGLPETVSAAALPTVQINGVVWAQVIVGNTVYVTGSFTQARPAGAAPGVNQTPRSNILAYNLTTGNLITTWAPTLNGQGLAITASANGQIIYVGGDFTNVNGTGRQRLAAINATTGALITGFNPNVNNRVAALAMNGNTLYAGGYFTTVGGQARTRLAAVNATSGAVLPWQPTTDREVVAMTYHAGTNRVIVGGSFTDLSGVEQHGMGSVDGTTGAVMPWAANQVIVNSGEQTEISALTNDGEKVYGVGWAYFGGGAENSNFEGTFAADPATGEIDWVDGGRGDSYGVAVTGDVVYVAGHSHDWGMLGWQPQENPYTYQRAIAISADRSPTLTNAVGDPDVWDPFAGMPAAQPLHWLPTVAAGTFTGNVQGGYSVAATANYVSYAGEFPRVNNVGQQGIVRFAKRSQNPPVDALQGYPELTPVLTAAGPGSVRVGWEAAWDRDNARLTVEVLRGNTVNSSTVLKSFTSDQQFWNRPLLGFVDKTAPPGSTQTYRIRVTDPYGNGFTSAAASTVIPDGTPAVSPYADAVTADHPLDYWRLGEATGNTSLDVSSAKSNDQTINVAATRGTPGALLNDTDTATTWPLTLSNNTVQGSAPDWQLGPQTFSLESWVNTTSVLGGKIVGFGSRNDGRSASNGVDRHIYMTNNGEFRFGVRPDMGARITINSAPGFNDGQWHHVVGTLSSGGMNLYVDGNLVATNPAVTEAQVYQGYWRIAGDRNSNWPSAPTREAIEGSLDEVAVYPTALSLSQVQAHYEASGRDAVPNVPPTANFTSTTNVQTANLTSTSTDVDGTITNWAWDFGDSTTGSGATTSHQYAAGGTYAVTLTVTDSDGATSFVTHDVTVSDPPPNVLPTAAFTHLETGRKTDLDASGSTDSDGNIASYAWDFGDSTTAPASASPTTSHTYAADGTYSVTVTVTDNSGGTDTETHDVTVANAAPTASFTSNVTGLTADVTSTSTDSDGTIASTSWDFGDSTPLVTTSSASHTYANPGTYNVTLTVTDNAGGSDSEIVPVTVTNPAFATDLFGRTIVNGLGNADLGGAWTLTGPVANFSVNGGAGRIIGTVGANRAGFLTAVSQRDFEATADVSINTAATGNGTYVSLIGRRVSNNNDYRLRVRYQSNGTVAVYLVRVVNNVDTVVAWTTLAGTVTPNEVLKLRLQVSGAAATTIRAKVWRASTTEPAAWLLTGNDAAPALLQAPGNVGILHYVSSSWTGAAPILSVDNYNVGPIPAG